MQLCRTHEWFKQGEKVLLAVSGGLDSMVMAGLFLNTQAELKLEFAIAHVHHGLRKASDLEEQFVRSFARKQGLPFFFERVDVKSFARREHLSIEEAARQLRYRFLREAGKSGGYSKVCTAHHLNDQAETVLMRILKGTGLQGLRGIRRTQGMLVRPLLEFDKKSLQVYAKHRKIKYVTDASNSDSNFLRNRIRNRLLPLIRTIVDPQAEKHLHQLSLLADDLMPTIEKQADVAFRKLCHPSGSKIVLDLKGFNKYLHVHKFLIVHRILGTLAPHSQITRLDSNSYNLIVKLANSQTGSFASLGEITCQRDRERLLFIRNSRRIESERYEVIINKEHRFRGIQLSTRKLKNTGALMKKIGKSPDTEHIDFDVLRGPLALRYWQAGDRFQPLGMQKQKAVSDFFVDNKVPRHKKTEIPFLVEVCSGTERIVWICGYRIDHRYRLTSKSRNILRLKCTYAGQSV